jgi:hypothetical protein
MVSTVIDAPDADAKLLVFTEMSGGARSAVATLLLRAYGDACYEVPSGADDTTIKRVTLQQARRIQCIITPRSAESYRLFGAPVTDLPLPGDGLFTGRNIIHAAIVDHPVRRRLFRQWRTAVDGRKSALPSGESAHLSSAREPSYVKNQQCALLAAPGPPTFTSAHQRIMSRQTLITTRDRVLDLCRAIARELDWDVSQRSLIDHRFWRSPRRILAIERVVGWVRKVKSTGYEREDVLLYEWAKGQPLLSLRGGRDVPATQVVADVRSPSATSEVRVPKSGGSAG